jgi:hypothetical protein
LFTHAFITLNNKYTYEIIIYECYACGPIPHALANPHDTKNALTWYIVGYSGYSRLQALGVLYVPIPLNVHVVENKMSNHISHLKKNWFFQV